MIVERQRPAYQHPRRPMIADEQKQKAAPDPSVLAHAYREVGKRHKLAVDGVHSPKMTDGEQELDEGGIQSLLASLSKDI